MRRRHPGITVSAGAALIGIASSCARTPDAVTDADRLPPLRVEEQLRIGSVDDPDAGFSGISAVAVDDDGLVYVRGALELPRTATVHWSRGDVLWTVVRDEFDVQWLVRYRIRAGARD